ncbi:FPR3 [Candida jiufengensis]|uniref:FPR3 n=1 Tax=Candida jiufengensis TaxID=497108 RepID=UPI0022245BC2|nr:FPR3 [Candida jiufengensis]KAI5955608.1 FPR3 [Candida jiufengensis]
MSHSTPISTYNLALKPFQPVPAITDDFPITIRLTLASLDPEADDDKAEPSTLRILKKSEFIDDDEEDDDEDDEDDEDEEDEDEEEDELDETIKANGSKDKIEIDEAEQDDDLDLDDEDDEEVDEEEDEISEYIVCTLSPKHQFQQTLDLTITPDEEVYFVVTGSYPIHLTGNYVEHPADETDEEDEDYDEVDEYDDEYDLTPDEDELIHGIDFNEEYDDEDDEDDEDEREESAEPGKIEELKDDEEEVGESKEEPKEKPSPSSKKRANDETKESKKSKKSKNDSSISNDEKKSVQFSKNLEQGPTGSTLVNDKKKDKSTKESSKESKDSSKDSSSKDKKFPTKTLLGGVITEDRKIGSGPIAKSNNKVGIRYIGKLKNGKVFDKNTTGKPFSFKLGKGECIKGFDLGVTGMSVGGERRVIIPAKMGYGSQALPGIPANSELTFDIKLVSLK